MSAPSFRHPAQHFDWHSQPFGPHVRMGTRNGVCGGHESVLAVHSQEGLTLLPLAEPEAAEGSDRAAQLRCLAYETLAAADPQLDRRPYWQARQRCTRRIAVDAFYGQMTELNIVFGDAFRAVREIWRGDLEAIGYVELPAAVSGQADDYVHHPAFLDACLQLFGATLFDEASRKTFLPIGMESFQFESVPVRSAWSHVRLRKAVEVDDVAAQADFVFFDSDFKQIGRIAGFSLRLSDREQLIQRESRRHHLDGLVIGWERLEGKPSAASPHAPAVVGQGRLADMLRRRWRAQERPLAGSTCAVVVLDQDDGSVLPQNFQHSAEQLLGLVQQLRLDEPGCVLSRLWFPTRLAQQVSGHDDVLVPQSLVWGLARSLEREYPQLTVCCIDTDADTEAAAQALVAELTLDSAETMVAYRGPARYVARIAPMKRMPMPRLTPGEPYVLKTTGYGSFDHLYLAAASPQTLQADDIEIQVRATGLNFKDVLHALGMLQGDDGQSGVGQAADMPFGGDCAGVVTRVGADVAGLSPGQRVLAAMAFGCFASHVVVRQAFVAPLPEALSFEAGAAIPTAYLTAYHALLNCAQLQRGDRVLIHAGAGGVGLAAIQLALHLGATVYTTASPTKHAHLTSLGVARVYSSRTLDFAEQLAADLPSGVDVVLNSLNGDFIERSFSVLRQGGSFVEIGKIGALAPADAARLHPDVRYTLFDLMDLAHQRPAFIAEQFQLVLSLLQRERLQPTRLQTFPISRAADAFRCMAEARHIGKVVVMHPVSGVDDVGVAGGDRHVVVGGLGAIGRRLVRWLAQRGARDIAVVGRHAEQGAVTDEFADLIDSGVVVTGHGADFADPRQALVLLQRLASDGVPLGDLYHLAGELADAVLSNQTAALFGRVLRAKADTAANLHLASLQVPHRRFIGFSSIAGVLGSPGQANYAAANALLDGIVRHRRARGLHGLAVNWGPWAGGGMAGGLSEADTARIAETGVTPLEADDAFALLEQLLATDQTQVIVADVDWSRAAAAYSAAGIPPCIDALIAAAGATTEENPSNLVETLRGMGLDERVAAMTEAVTKCLCSVLRLSAGDIEAHQSLRDLGLDSLMGMELRHKLERVVGAPVPVSLLLKNPRVAQLAVELMQVAGLDSRGRSGSDVAASTNASDRWLVRIGDAGPARPRLLCFHHLGGGAEYFMRWAEPLVRDFEVVAVQLPGRGDRVDEAPMRSFDEVFDALLPQVVELPATRSLLLYGHSMGSHLAFECVRRLRLQGVFVDHLFVSGLWSPRDHAVERGAVQRLKLSDVDMDLPQALRDDPTYMDALRGLVHADAALLTSYGGWCGEQGLDVPITAFAGDHDPIAPAGKVAAWSSCTAAGFNHHVLPGRHMFPTIAFDRVHSCIRQAATRLLS